MTILASGKNSLPLEKCSNAAQRVAITLIEAKAIIKEGNFEDYLLLDIAKMIQKEKYGKGIIDVLEKAFVAYDNDDPSALEKLCMVISDCWNEFNYINQDQNG